MPDVPDEALRAAVTAYAREAYCGGEPIDGDERVIRYALEAAAPIMAEAVARKILAHMEAHGPQEGFSGSLGGTLRRAWRRHFAIAARVAHFAFSTEEDKKQAAIEAIARGDMTVCLGPEPEGEK